MNINKNLGYFSKEAFDKIIGKTETNINNISNSLLKDKECYDIAKNIISLNENNRIINDNVFSDLEIFSGNSSDPDNNIINILNKTKTKLGTVHLENILKNPSDNINILEQRQSILKKICENNDLYDTIQTYLDDIKKIEKGILWFWKELSTDTEQLLDMVYFKHKYLLQFNQNEKVLQYYNYFKIIFAPIYGLLSPLFLVIMPYIYLKLFTNIKLNFKVYFKLLKVSIFSNPLMPMNMSSNSAKSKLSKYISIITSIIFYIQNVYNSFEISKNTNQIINQLHSKINNITKFVKLTKTLYNKISKHISVKLDYNDIPNIDDPLFEKEPYLTSNKGKILITFNKIKSNKKELIQPLKYLATIDSYYSICTLIKQSEKSDSKFVFSEYINNKNPILKIQKLWNPVLEPNKAITNDIKIGGSVPNNIIITGPNAGGKSTFIKALTLSILLSQTLTISSCNDIKMTPFSIINTYLNIPDCKGKDSLFESEMKRAKNHIDRLENLNKTNFSFVVMDEIFSSTNPEEGMSGGYAIGEKLGNFNNSISIITTHYNFLSKLSNSGSYKNYKIPSKRDDENNIVYPYLLKEGISNQYIALELLKKKGFDHDLVNRAIDVCQSITKKYPKKEKIKYLQKKKTKKSSDTETSKSDSEYKNITANSSAPEYNDSEMESDNLNNKILNSKKNLEKMVEKKLS